MNSFPASTKLVRLISARSDMAEALEAWSMFTAFRGHPSAAYLFTAMVIAYGRPFVESYRVGRIQCDYPNFPDFSDDEMNVRHRRMIDLRNKFLAHSSAEGTRVMVIPPHVANPHTGVARETYDHNIGKRTFLHPEFASWLIEVAYAFKGRLESDISQLMSREFSGAPSDQLFELTTGYEDFAWTE